MAAVLKLIDTKAIKRLDRTKIVKRALELTMKGKKDL
jgi:hypothetical protein